MLFDYNILLLLLKLGHLSLSASELTCGCSCSVLKGQRRKRSYLWLLYVGMKTIWIYVLFLSIFKIELLTSPSAL